MKKNKLNNTNVNKKTTKYHKHTKCKHIIEAIITILVIVGMLIGVSILMFKHEEHYYTNYAKHHMASITQYSPGLNNPNLNGKYTMIFYEDACPHCQKVIPKVYFKNKLKMNHIQYRDVMPTAEDENNRELATKMHVTTAPKEVKLTAHHGQIIHYRKLNKIN